MNERKFKGKSMQTRKKLYEERLAPIDSAIKNFSRDTNLWMKRAWLNIEYGELQQALDDLYHAVALDPALADAYMKMGVLYGILNQLALAVDYLSKTIQLAPNNTDAYFNRGRVYFIQQNYQAAIEDFSDLLKREPNNGEVYALRSTAYELVGEFAKALADAERFLPFASTEESVQKTQNRIAKLRNLLNTNTHES